jgi:hypothetical protein
VHVEEQTQTVDLYDEFLQSRGAENLPKVSFLEVADMDDEHTEANRVRGPY